ncbi:hypothetical protein DSO57_1009403 [Entomophthora muscae]|uniref:Uncharacterized protein n=1 Tax=Entomophthora muscae TaxID=34485 RepID=A0ACC2T6W0_9FUNG|nr:hypothetical protein DSO57_1009403 [Entomophthora muscae]
MLRLTNLVCQSLKQTCFKSIARYSTLPPLEAPPVSSPTSKVPAKGFTFDLLSNQEGSLPGDSILNSNENVTGSSHVHSAPIGTTMSLSEEHRLTMKKDPYLSLLVNLVMKNGEKAKAESTVGKALYMLRQRTLRNPHEVMVAAIEKASPLMLTLSKKTGSKVTQVPVAIHQRKRHRIGINWIIAAASKRRNPTLSQRLANEFIAILNGESSVLAKKNEIHKLVLANRSNATLAR